MSVGYGQDTGTYGSRPATYTAQEQAAYGGQSAYGVGGVSTNTQQPAGHYTTGTGSYGNH